MMASPVYETFAAPAATWSSGVIGAPVVETLAPAVTTLGGGGFYGAGGVIGAPVVETLAPAVTTLGGGGVYGAGGVIGAPVVETFAPGVIGGGMIGAAPAAFGTTTIAAPMTTMATPVVGTSYGMPPAFF